MPIIPKQNSHTERQQRPRPGLRHEAEGLKADEGLGGSSWRRENIAASRIKQHRLTIAAKAAGNDFIVRLPHSKVPGSYLQPGVIIGRYSIDNDEAGLCEIPALSRRHIRERNRIHHSTSYRRRSEGILAWAPVEHRHVVRAGKTVAISIEHGGIYIRPGRVRVKIGEYE